ncbi:MAG: threonine/serine dehydratase [Gammaproteobacteria bacterium]|nr:threonine/serine dehydratase [Gammaproteobacteria bacterium]
MTEALFQAIQEAHQALRPQVLTTPLEYSVLLSEELGCEVYFKCEHNQRTGSFKYRGASNKIRLLSDAVSKQGVITASTGNHGQGLALAGRGRQVPVTVYAPASASAAKLKKIELYGATIELVEGDALAAELAAGKAARERGMTFVSPYNDLDIIAGQGTVGMEIAEQLPPADAVFIAVGGGGLITGAASALKQLQPQVEIVACWPEVAHSMHACLQAGKIVAVAEAETLSDGTAGGVEPGSVTFELCQQLIDRQVLVSEEEIAGAMRSLADQEQWMVEGAAGVALAALVRCRDEYQGKKVVVVLCGRNITLDKYLRVLYRDTAE